MDRLGIGSKPIPGTTRDFRRLLEVLNDETLRRVAVWKMDGYSNHEIANKLACSLRTVAQKAEAIRMLWSKEPGP